MELMEARYQEFTVIQTGAQAPAGDYSSCDLQHQRESIKTWTKQPCSGKLLIMLATHGAAGLLFPTPRHLQRSEGTRPQQSA